MFKLSSSQLTALTRTRQRGFAVRVDRFLSAQVGPRWTERTALERLGILEAGCSRGVQMGIATDIYLAQFMLLYMIAGEQYLNQPDAQAIAQNPMMTWREKLFQLVALAGVDMSAGAPREA